MSSASTDARPTFAEAASAHAEAAARDPHLFPVGYLSGDPATRAVGRLVWFASPQALLEFLCTVEVALLQLDASEAQEIHRALAVAGVHGSDPLVAASLTEAFRGWNEILWLGRFDDLRRGEEEVARDLRAEFRRRRRRSEALGASDSRERPRRGLGREHPDEDRLDVRSIEDHESGDFAVFLEAALRTGQEVLRRDLASRDVSPTREGC